LWAYLHGAARPVSLAEVADTLPYSPRTLRTAASQLAEEGLIERQKSGRQVFLRVTSPAPTQYGVQVDMYAHAGSLHPPRPEPPFSRSPGQPAAERVRLEAPGLWADWLRKANRPDGVRARVKSHAADALRLLWSSDAVPEDLNRHTRERIIGAGNPLAVLACMVMPDGSLEPEALRRRRPPLPTNTSIDRTPPTEAERQAAAASFLDE